MSMINAIKLLLMEAHSLRGMTTPNSQTITEYQAKKNADLAHEYEVAAEALRKLHNEGFAEGIVQGFKDIVDRIQKRKQLAQTSEKRMDWIDWGTVGWPDWFDAGKRVEIERDDGTTVVGKLEVDDFYPVDDGDEIPVFVVIDDAGTKHSFADHKRWRFR